MKIMNRTQSLGFEFIKLVEIVVVQMLGSIKDEQNFNIVNL
jgi:hypothetical protein